MEVKMNSRERVLAAFNHREADRVPIQDGLWMATIQRWQREGLPVDANPAEFFDYDIVHSFRTDTSPRFSVKVVEETEEYVVHTTPYGGLRRDHRDYSTTPEIIDYPCKSREDWERIKERLVPSRDRVDWEGEWLAGQAEDERGTDQSIWERAQRDRRLGLAGCMRAREQGKFTCYSAIVGYDKIQHYVATEPLLIAIATEPDWVRDMYETDADLVIQMHQIMKEGGFEFDGAFLFCDLGYRNGLLFSPRHFEEQLRPTFQRLFDYFNGQGMPVILHSCGRVRDLIPYFIEDGLTCLQPLEVKAGMDLIELKQEFGDSLSFMGGIDVRAMADLDPAVIEEEIRTKISFAKKGGGYVYHSDHSVSNDVSFEKYLRVLELVRKYGAYG
jgi:uroporphyrinogen decarboxylase